MLTMWKFPLLQTFQPQEQKVTMPKGARIMTIQMQRGKPVIWALVDKSAPDEVRRIQSMWTGYGRITEDATYICTVQDDIGLVWHYFEMPYD